MFGESLVVFILWLPLTALAAGVALAWGPLTSPRRRSVPALRAVGYLLLIGLAVVVAWESNVTPLRADVHAKIGESAAAAGRWELALESRRRAVQLNPGRADYYLFLGNAYLDQAERASDSEAKAAWLEQARQTLERGWALVPDGSHYPRRLGAVYRTWAASASRQADQRERLELSLRYYLAAAELSPHSPGIRMDLAAAYFTLGYEEEALAEYERVVNWDYKERLAEAYAGLGDVYVAQGKFAEAAGAYQRAMQAGPRSQYVLEVRESLVDNNPQRVDLRERLALLYAATGRQEEALEQLQRALEFASEKGRAEIEQIMRGLSQ